MIILETSAQRITAFGSIDLGHRQEEDPQQIPGSHTRDILPRVLVGREADCVRVGRSDDEDLGYDRRELEDACDHRPA